MTAHIDPNSRFPNLSHLFGAYLDQDWSADGDTLDEIFENRSALRKMAPSFKKEISDILSLRLSNQELDDIFFGEWGAGYEPDEDEGETWEDVLCQIYTICSKYAPR